MLKFVDDGSSRDGYTPILQAAKFGHTEAVEFLMEKGAVITGRANDAYDMRRWALDNENKKLIMALIEKGSINMSKRHKGKSMLQWAAYNDYKDIVNQLAKSNGKAQYGDNNWEMMTTGKLLGIVQKINEIAKALNIPEMT